MKKHLLKTVLLAVALLLGATSTWADDVPTPVYFNDFSSEEGLTIVGNGKFEDDSNPAFGKIFHNNPTPVTTARTNWLVLPSTVLQHSATTKAMTIGFWVNVKNGAELTNDPKFFYSPIFTAYGADNGTQSHEWDEKNTKGWYPFFYAETRGVLAWNSNGYCDFTAAQNDKGTNAENTAWLDDGAWHYFTLTFTHNSAAVYVDGVVLNSWSLEDNALNGFFTENQLSYVCLGGNQAWGWNDPDAPFGFDDFAVYDEALSADQIKQIIDKKNVPTAIGICKAWETSEAFATAINAAFNAGDFNTTQDVYAFHTAWQVTNGSLAKVILNNEVNSTNHFWGDLSSGANYSGAPDTNYLQYNTNAEGYNVNQIVYGLPAGTYKISVWTYSSIDAPRKIYIETVGSTWTPLVTPQPASSDTGWKKLTAVFTLTETSNVAFGFYADPAAGRIAGFDNWQLDEVPAGTVVGATDCTTGYLGANSTPVKLSQNQKVTYTFYNYSDMAKIWDNWLACVGGETFDLAALKLVLRADPYELVQGSGEGITVNESYDNLYSEIEGAKVELSFTYQNNAVTVRADITAKSGNTYFEEFTKTGITDDIITVALGVEKSFLVITDEQKEVLAETKVMTDAGWATYCSANALDLTGEIANLTDAYIITGGNNTTKYVYKESVKGQIVPANVGLLLEGTAGDIVFPVADANAATPIATENALVGVTAEKTLPAEAGYVLLKENEVVAFYKNLDPFTLNANTAYLPASFAEGAIESAPRFYALDGETTGIDNLNVDAEASKAEGTIYNLAGQRVSKDYKGLVILNGKKVIIK